MTLTPRSWAQAYDGPAMETSSTEPIRPNPDNLLRAIAADAGACARGDNERRGRLKIFFGYAAGVGKTYAMLEAAHAAKEHGRDVVVGYIEPHTRPDTLALLDGLEQLPVREIPYKGITLREFDVDAALARKPGLILVDELAHTNAPGSRHAKRYRDVEELLHAGIDVFTTVNVQHLESLNDKVSATTEVVVQERIPDRIFDYASSVELVDLDPDDLVERLEGGKIYGAERAETALANFFSKKNLAYLRELALRRTADRLNRNLERGLGRAAGDAGDDVLVHVSPSAGNATVIRAAARLAAAYHGTLTALVVEPVDDQKPSKEDARALHANVELAEELGAHVVTVYGDDLALQIAQYALSGTISKIVIGSSENSRKRTLPFLPPRESVGSRLAKLSCTADVVVIADRHEARPTSSRPLTARFKPTRTDFAAAFLALVGATTLGLLLHEAGLASSTVLAVYLMAVLLGSLKADSFFYSILVSPLAVVLFNYFFQMPRFTLTAYGLNYPFTFAFLFVTSMVVSSLTIRMRHEAQMNARKAYRTEVLLETEHRLQEANGVDSILSTTAEQVIKLLRTTVVIYQVSPSGRLLDPIPFASGNPDEDVTMTSLVGDDERAVAAWVAGNNKRAGKGTGTLMNTRCLYLSIRGKDTVVGVAGIVLADEDLDAFEKNLLLVMLDECGQAVERERSAEDAHRIRLKAEQESLRANLLRSISHDLRTPLTSISGDASILLSSADVLTDDKKRAIYTDIYEDALWLVNLVENLLVVTRLDNGTMTLKTEPELVEDVIREAFHHLNRKAALHDVRVEVDDPLLMAQMDGRLIMQVIINLVNNAVTYTGRLAHHRVRPARGTRAAAWLHGARGGIRRRRRTRYRAGRPHRDIHDVLQGEERGQRRAARHGPGARAVQVHRGDPRRHHRRGRAPRKGAHLPRPAGHRHHVHASCGRIRGGPCRGRAAGGSRRRRSIRRRRGRMTDAAEGHGAFTVLIVEDDNAVKSLIATALKVQGYRLLEAGTGGAALLEATTKNPDVIILDLGLPDADGIDLIRQVRTWSHTPIIVVSARTEDADKVAALDAGADDYLIKPFSVEELLARLRVATRRLAADSGTDRDGPVYENGDLRIDYAARTVTLAGEEVHLTPIEYKLLALLARNTGKVLTHNAILKEVWGNALASDLPSLRVFMATLRKKIERDPAHPAYLQTHVGIGYRMLRK